MNNLIGLIALVLMVLAIIDIVKKGWAGGKKALWIVLVIILPFIGSIVYFAIGRKQA